MDLGAVANHEIGWTHFWVNTGMGIAGTASEYVAPAAIFYFAYDNFHEGGWDNLIHPPPPPPVTGYEDVPIFANW